MENDALNEKVAAISDELGKSSLIVPELTIFNKVLLSADMKDASVFFGTGLVAGKKLTQGLPFDFMGYLLAAERARRAFGLGSIVHLIADNHAKHETPEHAQEIAVLAENIKAACAKVAAKLGLGDKYTVILASEFHDTPSFKALQTQTSGVEELGIPAQAVNYLKTQLTDMEYLRRHHNAVVKLSWVLDRKVLRGSGGFDEKFFDNAYARIFGDNLSYVYTLSGRTFDSSRPRSSPYVAT
ncbi:MAG TPA: hypothetical protein VMV79_01295, partial [Alphaproteobacteria bacterium]|nr:hypothetical protein [Alphaproteobacteria bacterium]